MLKWIRESQLLSRFIANLSEFMSRRRGLPAVIGIGIVIISFVLQLFDVYSESQTLHLLAVVTLNIGVLTALIGLLLSDPLGK
ncbi:MAG: hypothetical protein JNJ61_04795 [Anaerolineae bacterium]|nr:hypothetical protein [Anaerolineae bacterium]